ncbi:MAG TPA: hypothetical protein VGJ15_03145 [Pirellulales bacterium]|jgi:hypothetical protein
MKLQPASFVGIVVAAIFAIAAGSVQSAAAATINASGLESFLSLPSGTLGNLENETVTDGSATKQTFTAHAGDVLSFDYKFLTNESAGSNGDSRNDFAFVGISPLFTSVLADTFSPLVRSSSSDYARETAFQHYSLVIQQPGTYTLDLGVVNGVDGLLTSGLLVDNLNLASGGISSPQFSNGDFEGHEPASLQSMGDVAPTTDFASAAGGDTQLLLNATISAVPEPSGFLLGASGMIAMLAVFVVRRNQRSEYIAN